MKKLLDLLNFESCQRLPWQGQTFPTPALEAACKKASLGGGRGAENKELLWISDIYSHRRAGISSSVTTASSGHSQGQGVGA